MNATNVTISIDDILHYFPIQEPYRFLDTIEEINANYILGSYTFKKNEFFYQGHFPKHPITPGAILLEAAAQIGLVAFGMYLLGNEIEKLTDMGEGFNSPELKKLPGLKVGDYRIQFYLVDSEIRFKKVILPGETIIVRSEKKFFKLNKLKCDITIKTKDGSLVAKGTMSGMVNIQK